MNRETNQLPPPRLIPSKYIQCEKAYEKDKQDVERSRKPIQERSHRGVHKNLLNSS